MVKQRMSTADIAAEVACLRARGIVGMRCTNVYDISPKVYVLKLARSGEDGDKVLLLVESGSRLHTVPAMPPKADTPSNFSLKLRKHVRSRRVESIRQLGVDRVVQITFGTGDATYHLLLEFYAQGNVILCDGAYEVLTLLRSHRDDAKGSATMARHTYPIHTIRLRTPLPPAALEEALAGAAEGSTLKGAVQEVLPYGPLVAAHVAMRAGLDPGRPLAAAPLDEAEREALLAAVRGWERWLDACDGDGGGPPPGGAVLTRPAPAAAAAALPGDATSADNADAAAAAVAYDEFEPLLEGGRPLEPHAGAAMLTFDTFDAAAAEFYGSLAGQRAAAAQAARERAAAGKLGAIKRDHEARLAALSGDVGGAERRAALIELNLAGVDAALNAVREALAGGMDWGDLGRMVKEERRAGNPVAGLIDALHLDRNKLTLALRDPLEEEEEQEEEDDEAGGGAGGAAGSGAAASEDEQAGGEEEEEEEDGGAQVKGKGKKSKAAAKGKEKPQGGGGGKGGVTKVEVDLDLSAYANARAHFDARRKAADKARRTLDANKQALAAAEARAAEALAKVVHAGGGARAGGASAAAAAARKPYWFERFHWFVSSENYLVLSGRDAQQNELLVKRYMRKGDAYVHADLHGASSTVVKNPTPGAPIPPLTLAQAGHACVCRSAAWDAKVVTSAWWVHPEQVSRTAPTGEYLTAGSFMIRGRKNYLPPQPLVMGLAFLFRLEQGSVAAHLGERAPRAGTAPAEPEGGGQEADAADAAAEEEAEEEAGGSGGGEAEQSAYDAFMEGSFDTMGRGGGGGGAGAPARAAAAGRARTVSGADDATVATYERYGLQEHLPGGEGTAAEDAAAEALAEGAAAAAAAVAAAAGAVQARRHLSAKERQRLKKGKDEGADEAAPLAPAPAPAPRPPPAAPPAAGGKPPAGPAPKPAAPRGRAGKGKKARERYGDQDEAEREFAMAVLASAGQKKDRKERAAERKARVAARKAAASDAPRREVTAEDIARLTARLETSDKEEEEAPQEEEDDDDDGASDGGTASAGVAGAGGEAAPGAGAGGAASEAAEVAALMADEGVGLLGEEDLARLTQLDELTGAPRPGDVLLYAVPVCAPYPVVAQYKYRVKLVPGGLKKGKALRQAVELLAGRGAAGGGGGGGGGGDGAEAAAAAARERDLVRAVPEMEGIQAMVGGVRLQVAGLQKLQAAKKAKAAKKK